MFRVSQHPSSGVIKTVTAASGTGHDTGTATSLQLGLIGPRNTYTECPRRNVPDFGRVFLMLKYTDITQNTYVQN